MEGREEIKANLREALRRVEASAEDIRRAIDALEGDVPAPGPTQKDLGVLEQLTSIVGEGKRRRQVGRK